MSLRRAQVLMAIYAAGPSGLPWKQICIDYDIPAAGVTRAVQSWGAERGDAYLETVSVKDRGSGRQVQVVRTTLAGRQAIARYLADGREALLRLRLPSHAEAHHNDATDPAGLVQALQTATP